MKNDSTFAKKMSALLILEILRNYTDDTAGPDGEYINTMTQAQIKSRLLSDYGLDIDRKTVGRTLNELLKSYPDKIDCDVEYRKGTGNSDEEREKKTNFHYIHDFDAGEIRMLINSVMFSHSLSERECKQLIEKISKLGGIDQRGRMQKHLFNLSLVSGDKVTNESLLANLDYLDEAIDKGKKVLFFYNYYGSDKKLHPIQENGENKIYKVNPYRMVANNGRFYLKANYDKYDDVTSFRIDKITCITPLDEPVKPKSKVKGIDDSPKTEAEMLYMQPGEHERIVFRVPDTQSNISTVVEWLGKSVKFGESDGKTITCSVRANPNAMKFWAMQYSGMVEILEPESLREDIRASLREAWRKYNDGKDTLIESDENIKKLIAEWKQICEDAKAEKVDVKRLGGLVRKTHLMLLPLRGGEIEGQYSELILGLNKCYKKTSSWLFSNLNCISLILGALLAGVDNSGMFRRRNIPDDTLPISLHTKDDGRVEVMLDINNFEEGYLTLLQYTDKNAEEARKSHAILREKMMERHKEIMEQRRKEREEKKKREEK